MDIILTIPDAQIQRVADMVRDRLPALDESQQPINYTNQELLDEFKNMLRQYAKAEVQQYELLTAQQDLANNYVPIDPT